jgi:CheY-like chemotaxis protein
VRGRDGYYEYFFKEGTDEEKKPYDTRTGMLGSLKVKKGDKVAEYHEPVPGENGYTVLGAVVAPVEPKAAEDLKCVGVQRNGNEFFAMEDGFLMVSQNCIEVSDCYRIDEIGYVASHLENQNAKKREEDVIPLVLLVDDDPVMLKIVYGYLHGKYRVAAVSKPEDALRFVAKNTPDLVLLDYLMPRINGGQMLKAIRSSDNPECANLPVFFLTGVTDKTVMNECLNLYPQGYLLKPIEKEELLGIVDEFLTQNK